jgi:hypothetical protein
LLKNGINVNEWVVGADYLLDPIFSLLLLTGKVVVRGERTDRLESRFFVCDGHFSRPHLFRVKQSF